MCFNKLQRHGVDVVAKSCEWWPIVKYMSQVSVTSITQESALPVPFCRVILYCAGVSIFRHSLSLFMTFSSMFAPSSFVN